MRSPSLSRITTAPTAGDSAVTIVAPASGADVVPFKVTGFEESP